MSDNENYRYILYREVQLEVGRKDNGVLAFIMLNPSTAKAALESDKDNDPTIRKCIEFAKDWEYGQFLVVNLFAYISQKPRVLAATKAKGEDIVGIPCNHRAIKEAVTKADLVVCAWGTASSAPTSFKRKTLKERSKEVLELVKELGKQPHTISAKLTVSGQPQHPRSLNIPDDAKLKLWEESRWPRD